MENFESMPNNPEKIPQDLEDKLKEIKEALLKSDDKEEIKKLNDEFIDLWKKVTNEEAVNLGETIDEIRDLLWQKQDHE